MSYIDTRDLESELDELESRHHDSESESLDDEELDRMQALVALRDEFDMRDWRSGVTLIPESEFEDYARELAEDCYSIPDTLAPYVDWSNWADAVQMDYSSVEFDSETYYYRS